MECEWSFCLHSSPYASHRCVGCNIFVLIILLWALETEPEGPYQWTFTFTLSVTSQPWSQHSTTKLCADNAWFLNVTNSVKKHHKSLNWKLFTSHALFSRPRPYVIAAFRVQSSGMLEMEYSAHVFRQRAGPTLCKLTVVIFQHFWLLVWHSLLGACCLFGSNSTNWLQVPSLLTQQFSLSAVQYLLSLTESTLYHAGSTGNFWETISGYKW